MDFKAEDVKKRIHGEVPQGLDGESSFPLFKKNFRYERGSNA